jgi:poly(A) polymerase Pap1
MRRRIGFTGGPPTVDAIVTHVTSRKMLRTTSLRCVTATAVRRSRAAQVPGFSGAGTMAWELLLAAGESQHARSGGLP